MKGCGVYVCVHTYIWMYAGGLFDWFLGLCDLGSPTMAM